MRALPLLLIIIVALVALVAPVLGDTAPDWLVQDGGAGFDSRQGVAVATTPGGVAAVVCSVGAHTQPLSPGAVSSGIVEATNVVTGSRLWVAYVDSPGEIGGGAALTSVAFVRGAAEDGGGEDAFAVSGTVGFGGAGEGQTVYAGSFPASPPAGASPNATWSTLFPVPDMPDAHAAAVAYDETLNHIYVGGGGTGGSFVACLSAATGALLWLTVLPSQVDAAGGVTGLVEGVGGSPVVASGYAAGGMPTRTGEGGGLLPAFAESAFVVRIEAVDGTVSGQFGITTPADASDVRPRALAQDAAGDLYVAGGLVRASTDLQPCALVGVAGRACSLWWHPPSPGTEPRDQNDGFVARIGRDDKFVSWFGVFGTGAGDETVWGVAAAGGTPGTGEAAVFVCGQAEGASVVAPDFGNATTVGFVAALAGTAGDHLWTREWVGDVDNRGEPSDISFVGVAAAPSAPDVTGGVEDATLGATAFVAGYAATVNSSLVPGATGVSLGGFDSLLLRTGGATAPADGLGSSVGHIRLGGVSVPDPDGDTALTADLHWVVPHMTRRTLLTAGFSLDGPLSPPASPSRGLDSAEARVLAADPAVTRVSVLVEGFPGTAVTTVPWQGGSAPSFWEVRSFVPAPMPPAGLPALLLPATVVPAEVYGRITEFRFEAPVVRAVSARTPVVEFSFSYVASAPAGQFPPVLGFSLRATAAETLFTIQPNMVLNHTGAGAFTRAVSVTFDADNPSAVAAMHQAFFVDVVLDGAGGVETPYEEVEGALETSLTVVVQASLSCGFRAAGAGGDTFPHGFVRIPTSSSLADVGAEAGCALELPLNPSGEPSATLTTALMAGANTVKTTETVGPEASDSMSPPFFYDATLNGIAGSVVRWRTAFVTAGPSVSGVPAAAPGNVTAVISRSMLDAAAEMLLADDSVTVGPGNSATNVTFGVRLSRPPLVRNVAVSLEVKDGSGAPVGAGPFAVVPASVVVPPGAALLASSASVTEPEPVHFTLVTNASAPGLRSGAFYARALLVEDSHDGAPGEGIVDDAGGATLFVVVPAVEVLPPLPALHRGIPTGPLRVRVHPLPQGAAAAGAVLTPRMASSGANSRKLVFTPSSAAVNATTGEAEFEMRAAVPAAVDGEWAEGSASVGVVVEFEWGLDGSVAAAPRGTANLSASVGFFAVATANRSAGRGLDGATSSPVPVLVAAPRAPDASLELALAFASDAAMAAAFPGASAAPSAPFNDSAAAQLSGAEVAGSPGGGVSGLVFACGGVGAGELGTGSGSVFGAPSPPVPAPAMPAAVAAAEAAGLSVLEGECEMPPGVGGPFTLLLLYRVQPGEWLLGAAAAGVLLYAAPQPVPGTVRLGAGAPVGRTAVDVPVGSSDVYMDVDGAGSDPTSLAVTLAPPGTPPGDAAEIECVVLPLPAVLPAAPGGVAGRYTVGCRVAASQGSGLIFTVRAGGLEGTGSDTLSFVQVPEVLGVSGCAAEGCRTAGGDTVTLTGVHLGVDYAPLVEVGGVACENPTVPAPAPDGGGNATVECTLGAGSGVGRPVSVARASGVLLLRSNPLPAVDFAAPVVDALGAASGSCGGRGAGNATLTGCTREGGWRLTVEGRHFGVAAADLRVLVGPGACGNATVERVSDALDWQRVTCDAPPGATLDQAVLVIAANGGGGGGSAGASVSYAECPPGTFRDADAAACSECPPFEFQDVPGQSQCRACEDGRYQPASERELALCLSCPDGARCLPSLPVLASDGFWLAPRDGAGAGGADEAEPKGAAAKATAAPFSYRCHGTRCLDASECFADSEEQRAAGSEQLSCCGPDRPPADVNPLCGRCNDGLSEWSGSCVECGGVNYNLLFGYLALGIVLLAALRASSANTSGAGVKVFVTFGQTVFAFYHDRPRVVSGGAALSLNLVMLSPTCVAPLGDLTKAVMPVVQLVLMLSLLGVLALLGALHWALFARGRGLRFKRSGYMRVAVALVSFSSLPLLRTAVTLLLCVDVGGTRYLRDYPSVVCGSGGHTAWLAVTWTLAAALVLGGSSFVLFYGQRQYRAYLRAVAGGSGKGSGSGRPVSDAEVKRLRKEIETRYGFLFLAFRGSLPGRPRQEALTASWEAVNLARAFLFVLCSTLLQEWRARFMGLSLVAFLAQALHLSARPYRTSAENMAETLSLGTMVVIGTLNSGAGPDNGTAGKVTSLLFYGYLVGLFVWGVGGAARRGVGAIARSVRKIKTSSSASLASSADMEAEGPGEPWTTRVARFFCWYMPEAGAGVAARAWPGPVAERADAAHAAEGVELCEMSISEDGGGGGGGGDETNATGAGDSGAGAAHPPVVDAMGRRWVCVPAWSCHETGESQ